MRIGLIDLGTTKLPNFALQRLSTFYKAQGCEVKLMAHKHYTVSLKGKEPEVRLKQLNSFQPNEVDKTFISCIFTKDRDYAAHLASIYPNATIGGSGWDLEARLPAEVAACVPDYELYSAALVAEVLSGAADQRISKATAIVDSGIGRTAVGCSNRCSFCVAWRLEPEFKQEAPLSALINPKSNLITLLDNNLTQDPLAKEKLFEARDRGLQLNITQGVDVRGLDGEIAQLLSNLDLFGNLHWAWDQPQQEDAVYRGHKELSRYISPHEQTAFVLCGFNSEFEEDEYRVRKLHEWGVRPYVMLMNWNEKKDIRLQKFQRYVNQFFFRRMLFSSYEPWKRIKDQTLDCVFA